MFNNLFAKIPFKNLHRKLPWLIAMIGMASVVDVTIEITGQFLNLDGINRVAHAQNNPRNNPRNSAKNNADEDRIKALARQTTVYIKTEDDESGRIIKAGSGVIIGKKGDTYYVLTCLHVLKKLEDTDTPENNDKYVKSIKLKIIAPDGQKYDGKGIRGDIVYHNKVVDLAVVTFKSNRSYRTAELAASLPNIYERRVIGTNRTISTSRGTSYGLSELQKFPAVIISGFPLGKEEFDATKTAATPLEISAGYLVNTNASAFSLANSDIRSRGYRLMYSNLTREGMSGGPVFNAEGQVIGIHGRSDGDEVDKLSGDRLAYNLSLAVPIQIFIKYGAADLPIQVNFKKVTRNLRLTEEKWIAPNVHDSGSVNYDLEEGNQAWRLGNPTKAKAAFTKALSKAEDELKRAEILFLQGFSAGWYRDFDTAYENCKRASELVETQNLEAVLRLKNKSEHKRVLDLGYRSWRCRAGAALRRENADLNEALTSLERAIEINRFSQEQKQATWQAQREAEEEAQREAKRNSTQVQPIIANPNDYLERGQIFMYQQEWTKATVSFLLALKIDPDFWMPRIELAWSYLEDNRLDEAANEARAVLDQSKSIDPENPYGPSYTVLIRVHMARKDLSRALATVEEGLRWVKNDPSLYDDKGVILREMGRIQPAKAAFIRALELDPNYADAARHLQELSR